MKFVELTEKEFCKFSEQHEQGSFFQTVELARLRQSYGSKIHYLGVKEKNKVIAASMFSETKTLFGKSTFYAPRGFLIDYHNFELLKFYKSELVKYCKARNGMMIKIDPNVIYQVRGNDGSELKDEIKDDETINNLKKLGFKHYGFNKDFITQSRWNFRVELNKPYEELKSEFSKTTRKNIDSTYKKGVRVRVGTLDDLESMEEILVETAKRRGFRSRNLEYYKRMYKHMKDKLNIYIAYLDANTYLQSSETLLEEAKSRLTEIENKMAVDNIGNKLINQKETALKQIEKYEEEVNFAKDFKEKYPNGKDIGVLISLKSGLEYLTLYSGILVDYKKFTPKYAMYNAHLLDAYKFKIPYANFYGISGIFDPKDKNYGLYDFKRGFGGNVIELIGEFSLPLNISYYLYNLLHKSKIFIRKLRDR